MNFLSIRSLNTCKKKKKANMTRASLIQGRTADSLFYAIILNFPFPYASFCIKSPEYKITIFKPSFYHCLHLSEN